MTNRILLCTYKGEVYLEAQLVSMEGQTGSNFRLFLSDDVPTGRSSAIDEVAAAHDERVTATWRVKGNDSATRHLFEGLCGSRFFSMTDESDHYLFSDQGDVRHLNKLATEVCVMRCLKARYGKELPLLVHCDMRVADAVGWEIAPSYVRYQKMSPVRWHFHQLLVQNNATGGATLMNHVLVWLLVAHPVPEHAATYDHWIALVTTALGHTVYLDRAPYDYRQHGDNVLGTKKGSALSEIRRRLDLAGESFKEMNEKSGVVYCALSLQAEGFRQQYGEELSMEAGKTLDDSLTLQHKTRVGRAVGIPRGGFTFNLPHRTLGELLFL